ncbi:unnamed protein product [Caretta caretta]
MARGMHGAGVPEAEGRAKGETRPQTLLEPGPGRGIFLVPRHHGSTGLAAHEHQRHMMYCTPAPWDVLLHRQLGGRMPVHLLDLNIRTSAQSCMGGTFDLRCSP